MGKGTLGLLLIFIAGAMMILWIYPAWNEISAIKLEREEVLSTLDRAKNLLVRKEEIQAQFNSISSEDMSKLEEFFPRSPDSGVWLINVSELASQNGMLFKGISMEEGKEVQKQDVSVESSENFETFKFALSASGNYTSLISFLGALEKSRRLIEIDSLSFSSDLIKGDFYEYTINAHTFWRK